MTPTPPIPTLEDVARAAGVSTATVSRCLNAKTKVSAATRDRVERAVEALGYVPNFNARAMAAKRSHTIGAIIPTMENAIFARGLQAFQEHLHGLGYTLLVSSSAYRPEREIEQVKALVARGADGLLLIGHARAPDVYDHLRRFGVPVVLAWSMAPDRGLTCVGFDNRGAMRALADRVVGLGHRRLGVISGVLAGNDRAQDRLRGIQDSLRAHDLPVDGLPVEEAAYEIETGAAAFDRLMQAPFPPTAVMCGNDVLAAGAIWRAKELGLAVPGDLSITGFDDIELARHVHPALTTVHVPHREMGRRAAEELVQMIDQGQPPRSVALQTSLVLRASLGPPPASNRY